MPRWTPGVHVNFDVDELPAHISNVDQHELLSYLDTMDSFVIETYECGTDCCSIEMEAVLGIAGVMPNAAAIAAGRRDPSGDDQAPTVRATSGRT